MAEMMTENYCDDCDDVLNAVFDEKEFWSHKVGLVKCMCGCIVKPCNECDNHYNCSHCPWEKAKVTKAMTDLAYMKWLKKNEPDTYEIFRSGQNGDYYNKVIEKIEKGAKKCSVTKRK